MSSSLRGFNKLRFNQMGAPPPTADAGVDRSVSPGHTITFDATASSNLDWIDEFRWSFYDDGDVVLTSPNPEGASYTFSNRGTFPVTLTVTDLWGSTDEDTMTVGVYDNRFYEEVSTLSVSDSYKRHPLFTYAEGVITDDGYELDRHFPVEDAVVATEGLSQDMTIHCSDNLVSADEALLQKFLRNNLYGRIIEMDISGENHRYLHISDTLIGNDAEPVHTDRSPLISNETSTLSEEPLITRPLSDTEGIGVSDGYLLDVGMNIGEIIEEDEGDNSDKKLIAIDAVTAVEDMMKSADIVLDVIPISIDEGSDRHKHLWSVDTISTDEGIMLGAGFIVPDTVDTEDDARINISSSMTDSLSIINEEPRFTRIFYETLSLALDDTEGYILDKAIRETDGILAYDEVIGELDKILTITEGVLTNDAELISRYVPQSILFSAIDDVLNHRDYPMAITTRLKDPNPLLSAKHVYEVLCNIDDRHAIKRTITELETSVFTILGNWMDKDKMSISDSVAQTEDTPVHRNLPEAEYVESSYDWNRDATILATDDVSSTTEDLNHKVLQNNLYGRLIELDIASSIHRIIGITERLKSEDIALTSRANLSDEDGMTSTEDSPLTNRDGLTDSEELTADEEVPIHRSFHHTEDMAFTEALFAHYRIIYDDLQYTMQDEELRLDATISMASDLALAETLLTDREFHDDDGIEMDKRGLTHKIHNPLYDGLTADDGWVGLMAHIRSLNEMSTSTIDEIPFRGIMVRPTLNVNEDVRFYGWNVYQARFSALQEGARVFSFDSVISGGLSTPESYMVNTWGGQIDAGHDPFLGTCLEFDGETPKFLSIKSPADLFHHSHDWLMMAFRPDDEETGTGTMISWWRENVTDGRSFKLYYDYDAEKPVLKLIHTVMGERKEKTVSTGKVFKSGIPIVLFMMLSPGTVTLYVGNTEESDIVTAEIGQRVASEAPMRIGASTYNEPYTGEDILEPVDIFKGNIGEIILSGNSRSYSAWNKNKIIGTISQMVGWHK